jgi:hypothetical protein
MKATFKSRMRKLGLWLYKNITRPPFYAKYRKGDYVCMGALKGTISKVSYRNRIYWYHIKELDMDFPERKIKRLIKKV